MLRSFSRFMLLPVLRAAALAATLSLASLAASAQTFGEFLNKPELPLTFMGVDYSNTKYYGPPFTVDQGEMKGLFTKINELLEKEADKYDLGEALRRTGPVAYVTYIAESVNLKIDPGTIIVPSDAAHRAPFTPQTVEDLVGRYTYPAGSTGIGLVFVVEEIVKNKETEIFWVTFVDLSTKKMLYTEKMAGAGLGFGFRNHWAHPLNDGISNTKSRYREWKKRFAKA